MKTIDWDPASLIALMGLQEWMTATAFRKLSGYMDAVGIGPKKTIRNPGTVEGEARVLLSGLVGMYFNQKLIRLYFPGDIFMDLDAYLTQVPSKYGFRSMDHCGFARLSFPNERRILEELPDFRPLSKHLLARVRNEDANWLAFSQMHYSDKMRILEDKVPNLRYKLTSRQLADLLGVSVSTVSRNKNAKVSGGRRPSWLLELERELACPWESPEHPHIDGIEHQTIVWASEFRLILRNKDEVLAFRRDKLAYLTGRLYPEAAVEDALWISKLYQVLFYLDDLSDRLPQGQRTTLWDLILSHLTCKAGPATAGAPTRIMEYVEAFSELFGELWARPGDRLYQEGLVEEVFHFLKSNREEASSRDRNRIPSLEEYLASRTGVSGGRLAVFLTGMEMGAGFDHMQHYWALTQELRDLAARIIFLANDLISFRKEHAAGDVYNYLYLLMHHHKWKHPTAKKYILEEYTHALRELADRERALLSSLDRRDGGLDRLLRLIRFTVSGSVHWSLKVTSRYIN